MEGTGTRSRNPGRHGASQERRTAGFVIAKRSFGDSAQLPTLRVGFDLGIPGFGIEPCKPLSERVQLFSAETLYPSFQIFDRALILLHVSIIPTTRFTL